MRLAAALPLPLLLALAPASAQGTKPKPDAAPRWIVPEAGLDAPIPKGWAVVPGHGGREILKNVAPGVVYAENINLNVRSLAQDPGLALVLKEMRAALERSGMTVERAEPTRTAGGEPIGVLELTRPMAIPGGKARLRQLVWYLPDGERTLQVVCTCTAPAVMWSEAKPAFDAFQAGLRLAPLGKLTAPPAAAPPARAFPTRGFTLTPPAGWYELPARSEHTAVCWVKRAPQRPRRKRATILSVEVRGDPAGRAEAFARDVARRLHATVAPATKLGGVEAWLVSRAEPPFRSLFCARSGLVYTLSLEGSADAAADAKTFEALVAGWRWQPVAPPGAHLQLLARPRSILNAFLIRLPEVGRPREKGKTALQWVVTDHTRHDVEVLISLELAQIPKVATQGLETFCERYGRLVSSRLGFDTPPEWEKTRAAVPCSRSEPLRFTKGGVSLSIVYGVFFADRDTAVAVTITTTDPKDEAQQRRNDALAAEIIDSIRLPRAVVAARRKR